jgi:hypothetical protein
MLRISGNASVTDVSSLYADRGSFWEGPAEVTADIGPEEVTADIGPAEVTADILSRATAGYVYYAM